MLKKLSRFLIVAAIELTVLVLALLLLAPFLLDSMQSIAGMADTLKSTRFISFLIRVFVYIAIFYAWPALSKRFIQTPSVELAGQINRARYILLGALLSIEALYWVGQL